MSGVILAVFLECGSGETESHDQENEAGHFQPQLMQGASEGACRSARGAHYRGESAAASGLLSGNARDHSNFTPRRYLVHCSILTGRGATMTPLLIRREPLRSLGHLRGERVMQTSAPDFTQLKSGMKATWMAGDFGQIASFTAREAEDFVGRIGITGGAKVLDIACGTGNTSIPAAKTGASVTGLDIATNLLEQARNRAAAEKLDVRFEEGDAEAIPFADHSFDVVLTMFGAMFAPRPEKVAAELLRVCKRGGVIAMANWTPQGFVGKSFEVTAKLVPPPPVPAPVLWGDEAVVRQRLESGTKELKCKHQHVHFAYPFSPKETVAFFRRYFGPTQMAFARLDEAGQAVLAAQLESLWNERNTAKDGTTAIEGEYLEVHAIRA